MAKKKTFENIISNLLGEPVSNLCHAFYDQYVEANVKFRSRAGMKEVIIRRQLGKCCKWCADLAGIYEYGDHPDDVFRRHDNCKCMVTYKDEDGYQDVWSKKEFQNQKKARQNRELEIRNETEKKLLERSKFNQNYYRNLHKNEGQFETILNPRDDGKQTDIIKPRNIIKDLNKSEFGREALNHINKNRIPVHLIYNTDPTITSTGYYDPFVKVIIIYVNNTKTIEETALTVIHEATHAKLGGRNTRKQEVKCFIQEARHTKRNKLLTYNEIKNIIKSVNTEPDYANLSWR